ncbi:MAG TPA: hypothetical protein VFF69_12225 [Phycisphaerales bacterium]|nr:hypothetical protein [Phycisphaerales bacterium]
MPSALAEELTGRLRCASCRYELRGLSVMGECPECGLPIQATLLSIVDPKAEELQPLAHPRLVGAGLVAWIGGAILAALAGWAVWVSGVAPGTLSPSAQQRLIVAGAVALALSALGALAIVRPHPGVPRARLIAAACGVALYPATIWLYVTLGRVAALGPEQSLLGAWTGTPEPAPWRARRMVLWLLLAAGGALLRGPLRMLAARSLVLRAQRVDRQTVTAGVAALLVAALGDAIGLVAPAWGGGAAGSLVLVGEVLVLLGAVLMTLGIVGVAIDVYRVLPSVIHRPLARRDVVTPVTPREGADAHG